MVRSAGTGQWYGGNRFKQQQRAPRPQAYPRPQGFGCGPFDSFGVGVGSMNLGDVERIMQARTSLASMMLHSETVE